MCSQSRQAGVRNLRAVEVGADAHLDALDEFRQDQARRLVGLLEPCEKGAQVAPVGKASDVVVDRGGRAVELQHIAGRALLQKLQRVIATGELPEAGGRKTDLPHHTLRVAAVVLEPVAVSTAADDVEAVTPQRVLRLAAALRNVFEQDDAFATGGTEPRQLGPPIRDLLDQAGERSLAQGVGD